MIIANIPRHQTVILTTRRLLGPTQMPVALPRFEPMATTDHPKNENLKGPLLQPGRDTMLDGATEKCMEQRVNMCITIRGHNHLRWPLKAQMIVNVPQ